MLAVALVVLVIAVLCGPYRWAVALRSSVKRTSRGIAARRGWDHRGVAGWMASHAAGLQLAGAVVAGILLLIVSVSWISFLIIGVLLAAYEVYLQRIKPAPPDETPPASGPGDQAALPSPMAKPNLALQGEQDEILQAPHRPGRSMSSAPRRRRARHRLPPKVASHAGDALPEPALARGDGAPRCRRGQQAGTRMIVLNLVLIGLVITLEPLPLTAFILILSSKGGVRKGAAFIFGWLLSLAIVIAFTVLVTGNNPPKPSTAPSLAALAAKLAIGVGLTVIAIRQYKKMGKPKPPKKPPRWQTHIDNMTPWYAIGLGPLTQPWALIAAGVSVIVEAKLSSWQSYLALALFCVIATSSILAMEIYAGFRPEPAQEFLARLRHWIDTHTDQVIIIVSLVLGFWLVGNSIYYLIT